MLDQKYINEIKVDLKMNNLNNSEPRRKHKKSSINSSGDMGTINDFQLVIDYNNTKNHDLYEEKLYSLPFPILFPFLHFVSFAFLDIL